MELRRPVELEGRLVRLVPLEAEHADALAEVADDPVIWRYLPYGPATTAATLLSLIETLLAAERSGTDLPFTVLVRPHDRPIGMTRFLEIDRRHLRAEIGGTWYGASYRRTPVNTECKLLLLRHAFEREGARRVQFKTDLRNVPSQRALERLGAVREGVLRDHMVMPDGYRRSSVLYSVVESEWPSVRDRLTRLSERPWPPAAPGGPA